MKVARKVGLRGFEMGHREGQGVLVASSEVAITKMYRRRLVHGRGFVHSSGFCDSDLLVPMVFSDSGFELTSTHDSPFIFPEPKSTQHRTSTKVQAIPNPR